METTPPDKEPLKVLHLLFGMDEVRERLHPYEASTTALRSWSPKPRAGDSCLLRRRARGCLYRQLALRRADRHERLLLAILRALEQVGDAEAVPAVERLAASSAQGESQERVLMAARAC